MYKNEFSRLIKECKDSRIYEYVDSKRHYIVKELLTKNRIEGMDKEIAICKQIKKIFPDFPCVIPKRTGKKSVFIQDYIVGKHYLEWKLNTVQKTEIVKQLIYWINKLEKVEINAQEQITGLQWKNIFQKTANNRIRRIKELGIINVDIINDIFFWMQKQIKRISCDIRPVYIHNDLNKENILINIKDEKVKIFFIDFEKVMVADPLKEVSKMVWLFRADNELGNIFWEEYSRINYSDLKVLKAYWVFDILYHLEKYNDLKKVKGWDKYLEEEIEILETVTEDNFKLW